MIVCSCNVIDDKQVRSAVNNSSARSAKQVYGCLGCGAECGRCARTIRKIMNEALAGATCATACGCCPAKQPKT